MGAILAALITLFYNSYAERKRRGLERRVEAYLSLLRAMTLMMQPEGEQQREGRQLYLEARHRLLLYGSRKVVQSFRRYYGSGRHTEGPGRHRFAELIQAMQKDCKINRTDKETIWAVVVDIPPGGSY